MARTVCLMRRAIDLSDMPPAAAAAEPPITRPVQRLVNRLQAPHCAPLTAGHSLTARGWTVDCYSYFKRNGDGHIITENHGGLNTAEPIAFKNDTLTCLVGVPTTSYDC